MLHAIIFKKPYDLEKAKFVAQKIIKNPEFSRTESSSSLRGKKFFRETSSSYRFRNYPKNYFKKKSFRTKKVNDEMSLIFGDVKNEYLDKVDKSLTGEGLFDFFKKQINSIIEPRLDFSDSAKKILNKYGNLPIQSLVIYRTPIKSIGDYALNLISLGKWGELKKKYSFDSLFHLALIARVNNKNIIIEKNATPNISLDYETNSLTETKDVPLKGLTTITINDMINKTLKSISKQDFFIYDPWSLNCQVFIKNLLTSVNLYDDDINSFVFQDISQIVKELPSYVKKTARFLTDVAGFYNKITGQGKNSNLNNMDKLIEKHKRQLEKLDNKHLEQLNKLNIKQKEQLDKLKEKHILQRNKLLEKQKKEIELFEKATTEKKSVTEIKKELGLIKPKIPKEDKAKEAGFENIEDFEAFNVILKETNKELKSKQKEISSIYKELDKNRNKFDKEKGTFDNPELQDKYEKVIVLSDEVNNLVDFINNKNKQPKESVQIPIPIQKKVLTISEPKIENVKPSRRIVKVKKVKKEPSLPDIKPLIPSMVFDIPKSKKEEKPLIEKQKELAELISRIKPKEIFPKLPEIDTKKTYTKKQLSEFEKDIKKIRGYIDKNIDDLIENNEKELDNYLKKLSRLEEDVQLVKLYISDEKKTLKTPKPKKEKESTLKKSRKSSEFTEKDYDNLLNAQMEYNELLKLVNNKFAEFTKDELDKTYSYYKEALDKVKNFTFDKIKKIFSDRDLKVEEDFTKGKDLYNKLLKRAK
jgi:hypothetical protein